MKALVIDTEMWSDNTNANLQYLKCNVGQLINESTGTVSKNKLEQNQNILDTYKEFIQNEESKINEDEDLHDVGFEKWFKVWKSPKYEAYTKKGKLVNEGSYICEILALLINIVISNLPGNPVVWDIWQYYRTLCYAERIGIYKLCLIEEVTIPLHITFPSAIYPLIHMLMTLRMAVACTIHKILYSSNSENSEHSSSEIVVMVSTSKNS
ncbi:hypothetical protein C1646_766312 [Rhizophagus diaphanus]|nr:hypothetical protein C1646_766312 [Rhizophagus diaphanus] [Rhizophagus sp. MUCL 43196]